MNPPSAIVVPFVDFELRRLKYVTQHRYLIAVPIGVHLKLGLEKGFLIRGKELTLFVFNALPPQIVLSTLSKHLCIVSSFLNSLSLQALANGKIFFKKVRGIQLLLPGTTIFIFL